MYRTVLLGANRENSPPRHTYTAVPCHTGYEYHFDLNCYNVLCRRRAASRSFQGRWRLGKSWSCKGTCCKRWSNFFLPPTVLRRNTSLQSIKAGGEIIAPAQGFKLVVHVGGVLGLLSHFVSGAHNSNALLVYFGAGSILMGVRVLFPFELFVKFCHRVYSVHSYKRSAY